MRRTLFLALAALVVLGILAPAAMAQIPPTPKVTISGLIDNMTTVSKNLTDLNFTDDRDNEWTARTRGRFDISAEIGRAKGVLGIEIDAYYGLTGFQDNTTNNQIQRGGTIGATGQGSGATSGFDINTDVVANIEVKWLYVEFPLPLIPIDSLLRVGAQPFATTYKVATLATGDFAGANLVTTFTPNIRWHLTYAQIEERLSGAHCGSAVNLAGSCVGGNPLSQSGRLDSNNFNFFRGDDYAFITSLEVTPIKGLDLRPIFSYLHAEGVTASPSRVPVGQLSPTPIVAGPPPFGGIAGFQNTPVFCLSRNVAGVPNADAPFAPDANCAGTDNQSAKEHRYTVGLDARWTLGPFSLRPTVMYQFGTREQINPFETGTAGATCLPGTKCAAGQFDKADISAWLADAIAGFRIGPLLLEMRGTWSTGNRPKDQLFKDVNYYQPIDTDTSFGADGWGNIFALGIDYFQGAIRTLGTGIGWDRYGRAQVGGKATYSFTPALDMYVLGQGLWTQKSVDTDEVFVAVPLQAAAGTRTFGTVLVPNPNDPDGDENLIGVELNAGLTWRFAPGLTLDMVYGHLFSGQALNQRQFVVTPGGTIGGVTGVRKSKDVDTGVVRVRYSF
jgi:hypothetical protein